MFIPFYWCLTFLACGDTLIRSLLHYLIKWNFNYHIKPILSIGVLLVMFPCKNAT